MVTKNLFRSLESFTVFIIFFMCVSNNIIYSQVNNEQIMKKAKAIYQKVERISIDSTRQVPSIVRGILAYNVNLEDDRQVQNFLQKSKEVFKINNQTDDFKRTKISTDKLGTTHLKLQQEYKGIPVWGSELILHASSSGELKEINGRFKPNLNINVIPAISSERALEIALEDLGPAQYRWLNPEQEEILKEIYKDDSRTWEPEPKLMIAPVKGNYKNGEYRLVWKMTVAADGAKLGNWEYFIDAWNGEIIHKFNSLPDITISGPSNYNGIVSFEAYYNSSTHKFELYDELRNIKTYTANNTANYPGMLLTSNYPAFSQRNAIDAHWGMKEVYDFWDEVFDRDSYDDNGGLIINTVDFIFEHEDPITHEITYDPNNARSVGSGQFLFGVGDGNICSSVTSLDVLGHEFNHTIDDFEANLYEYGESGAIEESLSDIMGTVIEFYATPSEADWLCGEDCFTPGTSGDAARYMNNPKDGGQPDTYQGTYWGDPLSWFDQGNVHKNSGVLNYAFYLMTEGGSGINDNGDAYSVSGIDEIEKSREIAYLAHSGYLNVSSEYSDARDAFLSAAEELYGFDSAEYKSVSDAFGAVGIGVRYIAKNNFDAGIIKINWYTTNSGANFYATEGFTQYLEAVEQYHSPYNYVWNTTGIRSNWQRRPEGGDISNISGETNISYTFTASSYNHNMTYIADLRKVLNITRNDQSIESGNTFNSANVQVIEGNSILAPSSQTVGGVNYHFYDWSDGVTANPRTITSPISELTARYKALQQSTDIYAYSKNGQRRLIETKTGTNTIWLHQVYTSNNHVWIEHSSDGGNTWILGNDSEPLDTGTDAKNPSIAYVYDSINNYNSIGVVWQQKYSTRYKIMGKIFNQDASFYNVPIPYPEITTLHTDYSDQYTVNANPNLVMAGNVQGPYLIVFERKGAGGGFVGLNWRVGHIADSGQNYDGPFGSVEEGGFVSGTNVNSTNAQISGYPSEGIGVYLIYQSGSPTGAIKSNYLDLQDRYGYWEDYQENYGIISYPILNFNPSIVTLPDYIYVSCWVEYEQLVFHRFNESVLHYYDSLVRSASINRGGNTNGGFVAWSKQNYSGTWYNKSMRFDNGYPVSGSTRTLNTSGKYLQVGNGANTDLSNMYVSSFYPFSSPYYFKTSTTLAPLSKAASNMVTGRGFMILNDDATFSYRLDGLNVDGQNIDFIDVSDTMNFGKLDILNDALLTEPFQLNANSEVVFSERSGFADSVSAGKAIGKKDYIRYKVELIDNSTDKVIGTIKNKRLDADHTPVFEAKSFKLDTKGLTAKSVRAKITLETNCIREISPKLTGNAEIPQGINPARIHTKRSNLLLTKSFLEGNEALDKSIAQELATVEINLPVSYSLEQNYPNPFNPVTRIPYNVVKDGEVSIMVYNVRGQKVTELINGFKPAGSYTATFDGTGLASGIYFYRIKAGDFTDVKRMLLVK